MTIHVFRFIFFPHFIRNSLPSFARRPLRVVGIPVAREIFRFAFVTPRARFQLKDRPGISFFFRAIVQASISD